MERFKKILYIADHLDHENKCLDEALEVAHVNRAQLTVLGYAPTWARRVFSSDNALSERAIAHLQTLTDNALKRKGIDSDAFEGAIEVTLEHKKPFTIEAVKRVIKGGYDLVIKEADQEGKHSAIGFGSGDTGLLRKCPVPVWICRENDIKQEKPTIAVAIHPEQDNPESEDLNLKLLHLADSVAVRFKAKLKVLSCWSLEHEEHLRHAPFVKVEESKIEEMVEEARASSLSAVNDLVGRAQMKSAYEIVHQKGDAATGIPDYVDNNAISLLVMGTVARTGIPGFVTGNTAENIIQKLSCSMMAVKPDGFVSPVKPD